MLIEILVFDGVDELDAFGPMEVLRNAAAQGADFTVRLVSAKSAEEMRGNHGLRFRVDGIMGSFGHAEILIVPGGGWVRHSAAGAWTEAQRGVIPSAIARAHKSGAIVASVCTGAMLLATAGLLRGRQAVTHKLAEKELREVGAEVIAARIVDDGDIITSGGVSSGIDLGLYLVERFASPELAEQGARYLEHERRGPVHVSSGPHRNAMGHSAR